MELFLDDSKLFPIQTLPSPPPSSEISALSQWWSSISPEEQAKICRIDNAEILIDLVDITSTAYVLFKIAETDEEPAPLSCKETIEDPEDAFISQIFEFEFSQFELLQSDLQQIFSSYSLHTFISSSIDPEEAESFPDSYIECREGSVIQLLNLLTNLGREISEIRQKSLLGRDNAFEQYSLFLKQTLARLSFPFIESASIKEFFSKILAVTLLLEKNLLASYYEKIGSFSIWNSCHLSGIMADPLSPILKSSARYLKGENRLNSTKETFSSTASQNGSSLFEEETICIPMFKKTSKPFIPKSMQQQAEGGLNFNRKASPYIYQETTPAEEYQGIYSQENTNSQETANFYQGYDGFEIGNLEVTFVPDDKYLCGKDVDRFPKALKKYLEYRNWMLSQKSGKKQGNPKNVYYQNQNGDYTGKAGNYKKPSNFKATKENQSKDKNQVNQILSEGLIPGNAKTKREDMKRIPTEEKGQNSSHSTRNQGKNHMNRNAMAMTMTSNHQKKEKCT